MDFRWLIIDGRCLMVDFRFRIKPDTGSLMLDTGLMTIE